MGESVQTGRPSSFTQETADQICAQLAEGMSLRSVCRADDMPALSTVFKWLREVPGFSDQYARAKEASADAFAEEIQDIADDGSNDWMERHGKDGESIGWQLNGEHVQRSKLRIDTRRWIASTRSPTSRVASAGGNSWRNRGARNTAATMRCPTT